MARDKTLVIGSFLLIAIGCIFISSSLSPFESNDKISKHYLFSAISMIIILSGYLYNVYKLPSKFFVILPIISILLLLMVLVTPLGTAVNNSRRWLSIGSFRFQPTEFAKITSVFITAAYITGVSILPKKYLLTLFIATLGLIFIQPDVGQTLLIFSAGMILYFIYTSVDKQLVLKICGTGALVALIGIALFSHVRSRTFGYLSSLFDPLSSQYQVKQSIIAISSGSYLGKGIGNSVQKLSYLPEASTDFAASIIMEETGVIGLAIILSMFSLLIYSLIKISESCTDPFFKTVLTGFAVLLLLQTFINLMVNMSLLPAKGLNLPFIGYGGTSAIVFSSMISLAISLEVNKVVELQQVVQDMETAALPAVIEAHALAEPNKELEIIPTWDKKDDDHMLLTNVEISDYKGLPLIEEKEYSPPRKSKHS